MQRDLWARDCRRDYKKCELIQHYADVYLYLLEITEGKCVWQVWDGDVRRHASENMQEAYRVYGRLSGQHCYGGEEHDVK